MLQSKFLITEKGGSHVRNRYYHFSYFVAAWLVSGFAGGSWLIHLLLVVALVVLIIRLVTGRKVV